MVLLYRQLEHKSMVDRKSMPIETIITLHPEEAIDFVLRAITRSYIGDVPEPEDPPQQKFWIEKVPPTGHLGPFGLVEETGS